MAPFLRLIELRIPLRHPLTNARGAVAERRAVLVGITEAGMTGWGEAAPYPGITTETADDVWQALCTRAGPVLRGDSSGLPATAGAGVDQAWGDLAARLEGVPMWSRGGGSARPVRACAAIGLERSPDETVDRVRQAVSVGIQEVKVKIRPGRDYQYLRALHDTFPELTVAADANGSYREGDPFLEEVDRLSLAYLEQPLPAHDLSGHSALRYRLATPLCLDESTATQDGAMEVISEQAADIVSLKPGLLGVAGVSKIMERAETANVAVKIGGLVETSVGRAHALALATRPSVEFTDLVPPLWLMTVDVSRHPWELVDGCLAPPPGPGLGIEVDALEGDSAEYVTRSRLLTA